VYRYTSIEEAIIIHLEESRMKAAMANSRQNQQVRRMIQVYREKYS
jgi:hypothetical protein